MASDRDIELNITANDDASKVIDSVADKLDDIDSDKVEVELDADVGDAQREIDKFERKLDDITSDRGREVLIEFRGQKLEAEIKRATRALDALDDPVEIAVKRDELERAQTDLDDLRKLAADKYEVDLRVKTQGGGQSVHAAADDVGALGRSAEGLQSGIGPLRGFTDELGESSAAAGTAANAMVDAGEAVQVFGGLAGASAKTLGAMSAALGIGGVAVAGLSLAYNKARSSQRAFIERGKEKVEAYTKALKDTESAAEAVGDALREAGGVSFNLPDLLGGDVDVTAQFNELGVSAENFAKLVAGGKPAIDAWAAAMEKAGVPVEQYSLVTAVASQEAAALNEAQDGLNASIEFFAEKAPAAMENTMRAAQDLDRGGIQPIPASIDKVITKIERIDDGFDAATIAAQELDAQIRGIDEERRGIQIQQDFREAALILLDGKRNAEEQDLALLDLKDSVIDYATEVAKLPPAVTTKLLVDIDEGRAAEVEAFLLRIGDGVTLPIKPYIIPNSQGGGISIDENGNVSNVGRSAAPTASVTINLPRTAAGPDVVASVNRWSRYNGHR